MRHASHCKTCAPLSNVQVGQDQSVDEELISRVVDKGDRVGVGPALLEAMGVRLTGLAEALPFMSEVAAPVPLDCGMAIFEGPATDGSWSIMITSLSVSSIVRSMTFLSTTLSLAALAASR